MIEVFFELLEARGGRWKAVIKWLVTWPGVNKPCTLSALELLGGTERDSMGLEMGVRCGRSPSTLSSLLFQ
jgi:hypothetical protein